MKLLVLGGTRFLGRHVVEAARARGDVVTIFTRGVTPVPWPDVDARIGNRDPALAPGLSALETGEWDAAIDCSGYVPRAVGASARLLAPRVRRYVFVSSVSVYADTARPGVDETAATLALADPSTEDILPNYGALKAACEAAVWRVCGARATLVRPGLIVGPFDATDRFGYWVARFVHPQLLGARADEAVLPAPPTAPIQVIDARDLAAFLLDLAASDAGGTFNAVGPAGRDTFGDLVASLTAASAHPPRPCWIDEARLVAAGVQPWTGLPLWLPSTEPDAAGFMSIDGRKAAGAGLRARSLADTVAATADWLAQRDNAGCWKAVLDADAERALLAS